MESDICTSWSQFVNMTYVIIDIHFDRQLKTESELGGHTFVEFHYPHYSRSNPG